MKLKMKLSLAQNRRGRIQKKVKGTEKRPRLAVHFSNKRSYAECIDDEKVHTVAYASSVGAKDVSVKANCEGVVELGKIIAEKAKSAGVDSVVFDRAGRRYYGCAKFFAEADRAAGPPF